MITLHRTCTLRTSMQRVREYLTLVLIGLLPFHAFLVTVFTKIIKGNGNAPLTLLALWKEMLIVIILLFLLVLLQ